MTQLGVWFCAFHTCDLECAFLHLIVWCRTTWSASSAMCTAGTAHARTPLRTPLDAPLHVPRCTHFFMHRCTHTTRAAQNAFLYLHDAHIHRLATVHNCSQVLFEPARRLEQPPSAPSAATALELLRSGDSHVCSRRSSGDHISKEMHAYA